MSYSETLPPFYVLNSFDKPGDMILTATYKGGNAGQPTDKSFASIVRNIYRLLHFQCWITATTTAATLPNLKLWYCAMNQATKFMFILLIYFYCCSKNGLSGFYVGTSARIFHVASIITTQLVLYDIIKVRLIVVENRSRNPLAKTVILT